MISLAEWPFAIPLGGFRAIVADPGWPYCTFSDKGKERSADNHYKCLSLGEIAALPVRELAAKDCHLFLWVTGPCLVQGMHIPVIERWGFKPSSDVFVWLKVKKGLGLTEVTENVFTMGLGHTTRKNAEYVVLGRRGSPRRKTKAMHQLILAPRREHSRKPDKFFERVEAYCEGPYVELFARQSRPNWTSWGDELTKFGA